MMEMQTIFYRYIKIGGKYGFNTEKTGSIFLDHTI